MNNSKITFDNQDVLSEPVPEEKLTFLRQKEAEYVNIIDVLKRVSSTEDWATLKRLVFDGLEAALERQISTEAKKSEINNALIHRLQGQLIWAKQYSNFGKLAEFFKKQLDNVRNQIKQYNGKTN